MQGAAILILTNLQFLYQKLTTNFKIMNKLHLNIPLWSFVKEKIYFEEFNISDLRKIRSVFAHSQHSVTLPMLHNFSQKASILQ